MLTLKKLALLKLKMFTEHRQYSQTFVAGRIRRVCRKLYRVVARRIIFLYTNLINYKNNHDRLVDTRKIFLDLLCHEKKIPNIYARFVAILNLGK